MTRTGKMYTEDGTKVYSRINGKLVFDLDSLQTPSILKLLRNKQALTKGHNSDTHISPVSAQVLGGC